jgi:hypothetical protein
MGRLDLLFSLRRKVDADVEQFAYWSEIAKRRPSFAPVESKALQDVIASCMHYWDMHEVSA